MSDQVFTFDPEVDSGQYSDVIGLYNHRLLSLQWPTSGWTAAAWFIQARMKVLGGLGPVYIADALVTDTPAGDGDGEVFFFNPPLAGLYEIRLGSGAPGALVDQLSTVLIQYRVASGLGRSKG